MSGKTSPRVDVASAYPTADARRVDRPSIGPAQHSRQTLTLNDIRMRAYSHWEAAGRPDGDASGFWLEAEQELLKGK